MIIPHWREYQWDSKRWPNFSAEELSCSHCGEFFDWPEIIDRLQFARTILGVRFILNSAHRCWFHNQLVGGAMNSQHKLFAFDISLLEHNIQNLLGACQAAGFTGFGFYGTFLHVDGGPRRNWITKEGRATWNGLVQ